MTTHAAIAGKEKTRQAEFGTCQGPLAVVCSARVVVGRVTGVPISRGLRAAGEFRTAHHGGLTTGFIVGRCAQLRSRLARGRFRKAVRMAGSLLDVRAGDPKPDSVMLVRHRQAATLVNPAGFNIWGHA